MIYTICVYPNYFSDKSDLNQSNTNCNELLIIYKNNLKKLLENNSIFDNFEIYRKDKYKNNSGRAIQIDLFK